jgi:replication factor C small subunit
MNPEDNTSSDTAHYYESVESWASKYGPDTLSEVVGNQQIIEQFHHFADQGGFPPLLLSGPTGVGKSASIRALLQDVYGGDWRNYALEVDGTIDRGQYAFQDRVREFARMEAGAGQHGVLLVKNVDTITDDGQKALNSIAEQYGNNVQVVLECNHLSSVIQNLQSRCAIFRFGPIDQTVIASQLESIAGQEGVSITRPAAETIAAHADGDLRQAITFLEGVAPADDSIDQDHIEDLLGNVPSEAIERLIESAVAGEFDLALDQVDELLQDGMVPLEIVSGIDSVIRNGVVDVSPESFPEVLQAVGEANYRIRNGADGPVQLRALLAKLCQT